MKNISQTPGPSSQKDGLTKRICPIKNMDIHFYHFQQVITINSKFFKYHNIIKEKETVLEVEWP